MAERLNVLILGYGEMGHAMEFLLADRHDLSIWDKFADAGLNSVVLEEAVPAADFVLFCLPVNPHREVVTQIKPLLKDNSVCLSVAKGLDEAGQTAAQIFEDVLNNEHEYTLVYGPMISEEIRANRFAFAQVGCMGKRLYTRTKKLFDGSRLLLDYTTDMNGISWSVILKNVFAIVIGIADELQLGDNVRGFLVVQSMLELDRIVKRMGGKAGTSYNLAGLGDLVTTATSTSSHHHQLGRSLARGELEAISGEGIHTLEMVEKYQLFCESDFPLYTLIHEIIKQPECNINERMNSYLSHVYQ
jgi:glycerol-3-phosphate dehydrogenase (NAD(P)+)